MYWQLVGQIFCEICCMNNRLFIGHTRLTREDHPERNKLLTVKYILAENTYYDDSQNKYYFHTDIDELFSHP